MFNLMMTDTNTPDNDFPGVTEHMYCQEKLIEWATESMSRDLPDSFYQARLLCAKFPDLTEVDGDLIVCASHDVKISAHSDYEDFSPTDDVYPTKCIEAILAGKEWVEASIVFSPESVSFEWR